MYSCQWAYGAPGKVDSVHVHCRAQHGIFDNGRYEQALASVGLMSMYSLFDGLGSM